jgi:uncharacterized membrane protein YhfC
VVGLPVLLSLVIAALIAFLWPVAIYLICRRRMEITARNIFIGAAVFVLFSRVLEKSLHAYLLAANPVTAAWFRTHAIGFALYGGLAAGLFEEIGRYLAMRFVVRPSGNPGTAVAYAIGHGGVESILIGGLSLGLAFVFAVLLDLGRLDASLAPAAAAQIHAGLATLSVGGIALAALERVITMLVQIGLSLMVWRAVERRALSYLALAIALHALVDLPAGLFQAGQISSLFAGAPFLLVGAGLAALYVRALPPRRPAWSPK